MVCCYKTVCGDEERESVAQCLKCSSHDDRHPLIVMVTCIVLNISHVIQTSQQSSMSHFLRDNSGISGAGGRVGHSPSDIRQSCHESHFPPYRSPPLSLAEILPETVIWLSRSSGKTLNTKEDMKRKESKRNHQFLIFVIGPYNGSMIVS